MFAAKILFWVSLLVLVYTYFGYAFILKVISSLKPAKNPALPLNNNQLPAVTLVVPAFNEEQCIKAKIENCLLLAYPPEKINYIFITDGSYDDTTTIISGYPSIHLLHKPEREGKMAAINRAMKEVQTPIVVFSDANSYLNSQCIYKIVDHYCNKAIGGVAGEKKVDHVVNNTTIGLGEGLYWKYESILKQLDSNFNTVIGAAGELFSMRTSLYKPPPDNTILDDFTLSFNICLEGYKVVYEPGAFAIEAASIDLKEESKRRVRIAAGTFQYLFKPGGFKKIMQHPLLAFQYLSRRVARWVFCPIALVLFYFSNLTIVLQQPLQFYLVVLHLQHLFYATAILGWLFYNYNVRSSIFFIPFYFVFMNASLVKGFLRYIRGGQTVMWDKAKRLTPGPFAKEI